MTSDSTRTTPGSTGRAAADLKAAKPRVASLAFTQYDSDPRVRRMAESLVAEGSEVTAIVIRQPGQPKRRVVGGVTVVGVGPRQYRGGSQVRYVVQYALFLFASCLLLTLWHLREKFDVVHVNNMPDFLVMAALPAKLLGAAVILDIHDPMPELFMSKFGSDSDHLMVRLISWIEGVSVRLADRVISVHDVQLNTLLARGRPSGKFVVVQNAPDERYFPYAAALERSNDDGTGLVYHGLVTHRLGLDVAVRAFRHVLSETPSARFVIVGDGDGADDLEQLIEELDLNRAVDFRRGFIPVEDLLPILLASALGVVPSRVDPFTRNMLPTKLLEYVMLGIPVVSTELPAVRYYFDDSQIEMVPPEDPPAMANAIIELLGDPRQRRARATRALSFMEQYSWTKERLKYQSLIDELIQIRAAEG